MHADEAKALRGMETMPLRWLDRHAVQITTLFLEA
jgi:hypothetical protein